MSVREFIGREPELESVCERQRESETVYVCLRERKRARVKYLECERVKRGRELELQGVCER